MNAGQRELLAPGGTRLLGQQDAAAVVGEDVGDLQPRRPAVDLHHFSEQAEDLVFAGAGAGQGATVESCRGNVVGQGAEKGARSPWPKASYAPRGGFAFGATSVLMPGAEPIWCLFRCALYDNYGRSVPVSPLCAGAPGTVAHTSGW